MKILLSKFPVNVFINRVQHSQYFYRTLQINIANYYSKMNKPKIYVTRPGCPRLAIEMLSERYDVEVWNEDCPVPREELVKRVRGKEAIFCLLTDKIDKEVLDNAGDVLKVVATMSVGYDHIDVGELKRRGIKLGYTPDVLTDAVAELTVGLILTTSRRMLEAHEEILKGGWGPWSPLWMCGTGLKGANVGIIGMGRIGQEVAKRLKPFKIGSLFYASQSPSTRGADLGAVSVSLDNLLADSDFVIVTCALNDKTRKMFNKTTFSKMKPNAIFINTSRGAIVDHKDLLYALENGVIHAAGLDVTDPEPLPLDHPLLKLKNCVVLPHIGSATDAVRAEMALLTARNIINALEGKPLPAELDMSNIKV